MSFDVFLQKFRHGDAAPGGCAGMRQLVEAYVVAGEPERRVVVIEIEDGSADVHLDDDSVLVNHISGTAPWQLLVDSARELDCVIMPVGCPVCLTDPGQQAHLPADLGGDATVVRTGEDLLAVISRA